MPTSWPCAFRKVKTMPPPISSLSALASRLSITASLSDTFAPPSTTTYGRSGLLGQLLQYLDLGEYQAAGGVRQLAGDVVHAGLLAVDDTEAVADEDVRQRGQLVGQRPALGVVLALLARVVPHVLEQQDLTLVQLLYGGLRAVTGDVGGEVHRDALGLQQFAEPLGHRGQGELRVRLALGAAEVGGDDHLRAGLGQLHQRRQRGPDAAVVADRLALIGTFRSERTSTRRPATSPRSSMVFTVQPSFSQTADVRRTGRDQATVPSDATLNGGDVRATRRRG